MPWRVEVEPKPHYRLSPFKKIGSMPLHTRHKLITSNSDHNCKSKPKKFFLTRNRIWCSSFLLWLWLSMSIKYKRWRGAALETYHLGICLSSTSIHLFPPSLKSQRTSLPCNAFQCWYADPYLKSQLNPVVASIVYCFLRRSSTATVTELAVCVCLCSKTREMREQKSA